MVSVLNSAGKGWIAAGADEQRKTTASATAPNLPICCVPSVHRTHNAGFGMPDLRPQHDLGGGGAARIDILESARPLGERPLFDPVEWPEPAGGNGRGRLAKIQP